MTEFAMHGHGVRGMSWETIQSEPGNGDPGKFGRMFPRLPPLNVDDDILIELARAMSEPGDLGKDPDPAGDNKNIPAGFTYFGQFVDHDITLDTTPLDKQKVDKQAIRNFRSPALDLDSLYGDGMGVHPYLYQRDPASFRIIPKLLVGKAIESDDNVQGKKIRALPNDLPRNQVGHALVFDERNDENLLVAQTHLLMIKFHNAVVDWVKAKDDKLEGTALFLEARRIVTWHYQWIVLFDFVERLTEPGLVHKIKNAGRRYYRFVETPYMPAEFAAAAYRFGHSMVRETYSHNHVFHPGPDAIANGTLGLLFFFTGKSGKIVGELDPKLDDFPPNPHAALPSNWVIDWRRFFDIEGTENPAFGFNFSRKLDPFLTPSLHELPGLREDPTENEKREANLAFRNLRRGVQIGLPSGQDICRAMGLTPMTPEQIATGEDGKVAERHGLHIRTPLWYYVLKEAQHYHQGERLGPMASTIVAETFLGLVHGDRESFLWLRSNWKPELPGATAGHFTMADLVRFVGDINPIG